MEKVYELEYLEIQGHNIVFNYFLYKNLNSLNLIEKFKELKSEFLAANHFSAALDSKNLKNYLPENFTQNDILKLWEEKPQNQCHIILFEVVTFNYEFTIMIKEKIVMD